MASEDGFASLVDDDGSCEQPCSDEQEEEPETGIGVMAFTGWSMARGKLRGIGGGKGIDELLVRLKRLVVGLFVFFMHGTSQCSSLSGSP